MRKYDDYTCPKYGVIIYTDWDDRRKRTKRIRCEVCGAWCRHLVWHLNNALGLGIDPSTPPRVANELALKKSKAGATDVRRMPRHAAKKSPRPDAAVAAPEKTQARHAAVMYARCPVCGMTLVPGAEMNRHVITEHLQHHEGGKVECPICGGIMDAGDGYKAIISHIHACGGRKVSHGRR